MRWMAGPILVVLLGVAVLASPIGRAASPPETRSESSTAPASEAATPSRVDPVMLPPASPALLLLQRVRDESHRFAIVFQRNLRAKEGLTSILEELPGIGPTKRRSLLRHFGGMRGVRAASEADLLAVPRLSARDAATIYRFFDAVGKSRSAAAEAEERKSSAQKEADDPT